MLRLPGHLFVIAAGPVYVEFVTAETFPPGSPYHSTLSPSAGCDWGQARSVGGSAFKFAQHWAEKGEALLVSCVPPPCAHDSVWRTRAFHDDAQWLRERLAEETLRGRLKLALKPAEASACCDYTFHLKHPGNQMWPVFSIGGAAGQIEWSDVFRAWEDYRESRAMPEDWDLLIYLGGVLRTGLLQSLSKDLEKKRSPTAKLLADRRVHLFIDFGRTDLRMSQLAKEYSDLLPCVREAAGVVTDGQTAAELGLYSYKNMPRMCTVVRPHGDQHSRWWAYRRSEQGRFVERTTFPAPLPKLLDGVVNNRPAQVAEVVYSLLRDQQVSKGAKWLPYYLETDSFLKPEDITADEQFGRTLRELELRIQNDPDFSRILIYGPTGTGKEVVSRWLHRIHPWRSAEPFVAVSCGRLGGDLAEAELFGNTRGAYTGAEERTGAFVSANRGFLLIDDLDALSPSAQAMLLRVIEDGEVSRIGSNKPEPVDIFVVATTNVPPEGLVKQGRLRADLYYRLAVNEILRIPPLRERRADALRLSRLYWERRNEIWSTDIPYPDDLREWITHSSLEGNCRTLELVVEKAHRRTRSVARDEAPERLVVEECVSGVEDTGKTSPFQEGWGEVVQELKAINGTMSKMLGCVTAAVAETNREGKMAVRGKSVVCTQLMKRAGEEGIGQEPDRKKSMDRLLALWREIVAERRGMDGGLRISDIMDCLGAEKHEDKLIRSLLSTHKEEVQRCGGGRGTKYQLR